MEKSCSCDDLKRMKNDSYLWQSGPGGGGTQNGLIKILKITNENIGFDNVNQYSRDYMVTTYNDLKYCPFCGGKIVW